MGEERLSEKDIEALKFAYARLKYWYGENQNFDYMLALERAIKKLAPGQP